MQTTMNDYTRCDGFIAVVQKAAYRKSRRAQSSCDDETWVGDDYCNTLNAFDIGEARTTQMIVDGLVVRRLTVTEAERLQGFPDGWTDVSVGRRKSSDSRRYLQLGNAVTVNVAEWLARNASRAILAKEPA
jgi:site-specific DNA-cytosine methylase